MYVEDRLEQLEKEPNFNKKKARVQASHQWDSLSDPERQIWTKRAAEEGKKYIVSSTFSDKLKSNVHLLLVLLLIGFLFPW